MSGGIYLVQGDGGLVEMVEQDYASEALLQELLAKHPNLLAGDQIDGDEPRRWLLVSREMPLASEEDGAGRWSVDHLFLDQDAIPTIVEVKRSTDTRIRREVVGQMLDYAANAVVYWPLETLRARFEESHQDAGQYLAEFVDDLGADPEEFWRKVKTNLQAGKVRLVFVADEIPVELRRVVEFMNGQMDPAEVLAVEIKQYVGGNLKTLVPRVMGQTVEAQRKKSGGASKPSEKGEAYRQFFQGLIDRLRESGFTKAKAGQPQNWYTFASGLQGIGYGASFAQGGQARAEIYIDRGDAAVNKKLFDELASVREALENDFGEKLSWERLDERRACRVAIYRLGSIEDDLQTLEEVRGWMIERLLRFREVFAQRLVDLLDGSQG
ncbi:MAG: DUF4268 domain-containing protein [Actinomycetota bacterium]|nr:DUF4268 domain-containing protein [Actinomycetota bacterium]